MSSFGAKGLTNKGRVLQAKAQAGTQLKYTKYVLGDAQLGGQSIATLNGVISPKKTVEVTRLKMTPPNQATVGFVLSNQDVTTGFYFRELGLYALDPDEGEILYWYANAGDTADYIPPTNTGDVISKTVDMLVYVGTASNVTLTIDQNLAYVTHDELAAALEGLDPDIPEASLTHPGVVQLSNATYGTRENVAATEKAVKAAYDRGSAGVTAAATAQTRADSAFTEATAAKQLGVEQKANVVAALNSIGVTASTNDTWAQLVDKMAGVIRATGNATAADLLSGRTASNASGPITGTMPNRGAVSQTITTQNGSYNVPAGYHNGSGVIRAAFANLIASNIRAGVNVGGVVGSLIEGRKFAKGSVSPDPNGNGRYLVPIDAFVPSVVVLWRAGGNGSGNNYLNGLAMGQLPRLENGEPNYVSESGPLLFSDSYNVPVYISRGYFQPNNIFFPGQVTIFSDGYMTGTWNYIFFE